MNLDKLLYTVGILVGGIVIGLVLGRFLLVEPQQPFFPPEDDIPYDTPIPDFFNEATRQLECSLVDAIKSYESELDKIIDDCLEEYEKMVDINIKATVTNLDELEQVLYKNRSKKLNRHQFFGLAGIGPTGITVKNTPKVIKIGGTFGPVVGGGYRYLFTDHLGVGIWGLSNFSMGATISWEF